MAARDTASGGGNSGLAKGPSLEGDKRRRVFVWMAILLSCTALLVEFTTRICSQYYFNPLPDAVAIGAYVLLTAMLPFNEWVMARARAEAEALPLPYEGVGLPPRPTTLLVLAMMGSGAALVIAVVYTVLFLPVLPVALFPLSWIGGGFCGLSPLMNLIALLLQVRPLFSAGRWLMPGRRAAALSGSLLSALGALLLLVGRPAAIGYTVEHAFQSTGGEREAHVGTLRRLGAEQTVLGLCYRSELPVWTSLGRQFAGAGGMVTKFDDTRAIPVVESVPAEDEVQKARTLYYLMTGRPFESADASSIVKRDRFIWGDDAVAEEEQGGELVGRAAQGLSLASSRIDGVLDPRTETAYCEWTLVFQNSNSVEEEARAEILLPEGGVVDKVSLWINGEERPAAFGPRDVVRKAYQEVAVRQRRDPLLVTAKDSGRVLAQCFPVPAGGKMKIRLGMTAPLVWRDPAAPRLSFTPPTFQQVNFRLGSATQHEVWLEGHWPSSYGKLAGDGWLLGDGPAARGQAPAERTYSARLEAPSTAILHPATLSIVGGTQARVRDRLGAELERRESPFGGAAAGPVDLLVLIDTTRDMAEVLTPQRRRELFAALAALPAGSSVGFADARELSAGQREPGTAWLPAARAGEAEGWLAGLRYTGGLDPVPGLRGAWRLVDARSNPGTILWLHGATPDNFGDASQLLADYERRSEAPRLVSLRLRPGPDALVRDLAGCAGVYSLAAGGDGDPLGDAVRLAHRACGRAATALDAAAVPLGGREPAINGVYVTGMAQRPASLRKPTARTHTARLAAFSHALAPWFEGERKGERLASARKLAIRERLVTPLSGAVVLETKEQYRQHNLDAATDPDSIPSVPEPGTLAMLAVAAGLAAGWKGMRRRAGERENSNAGG